MVNGTLCIHDHCGPVRDANAELTTRTQNATVRRVVTRVFRARAGRSIAFFGYALSSSTL